MFCTLMIAAYIIRLTLRQSRPNKASLKCPSVCAYVRTYVRQLVLLRWEEYAPWSVAVFFLTCRRGAVGGAGGEYRSVLKLGLLI